LSSFQCVIVCPQLFFIFSKSLIQASLLLCWANIGLHWKGLVSEINILQFPRLSISCFFRVDRAGWAFLQESSNRSPNREPLIFTEHYFSEADRRTERERESRSRFRRRSQRRWDLPHSQFCIAHDGSPPPPVSQSRTTLYDRPYASLHRHGSARILLRSLRRAQALRLR